MTVNNALGRLFDDQPPVIKEKEGACAVFTP
jgi:hypothetical protein